MSNIYERCFIFSREQMEHRISVETANGGSTPKFGSVIVNGIPKTYTDIVVSMDKARYSDSTLLVRGDIRTIKYTQPSK
jgi:hypothetical protein